MESYRNPESASYYASATQLAKSKKSSVEATRQELINNATNYQQLGANRLAVRGRPRRHIYKGTFCG